MKDMLADCEHDIAVIKNILKRLRKSPETADRDYSIGIYQNMLDETRYRAAHIRDYIRKVGDDEK